MRSGRGSPPKQEAGFWSAAETQFTRKSPHPHPHTLSERGTFVVQKLSSPLTWRHENVGDSSPGHRQ